MNARRGRLPHAVFPAKAGIQVHPRGMEAAPLGPRLRGGRGVRGEILVAVAKGRLQTAHLGQDGVGFFDRSNLDIHPAVQMQDPLVQAF